MDFDYNDKALDEYSSSPPLSMFLPKSCISQQAFLTAPDPMNPAALFRNLDLPCTLLMRVERKDISALVVLRISSNASGSRRPIITGGVATDEKLDWLTRS
jgi:hypothetical protein